MAPLAPRLAHSVERALQNLEVDLQRIVSGNEEFMAMLRIVRQVAPPDWCVGAGAVRALVWDFLHGRPGWRVPKDIDICYFDPYDLSEEAESSYAARLREIEPNLPWEVANQARVHLWYGRYFGFEVPPLGSIEEAVATWPEYATCVAVRLRQDDHIEVIAPFGLQDLFSMIIRRNPARVSVAEYQRRIATKRYAERWPGVTIESLLFL